MNWPNNTDMSKSNWTGRVQRVSYGYQLQKFDDRIPLEGWIIGALILFSVFGFIPLLYLIFGA